MCCTRFCFLCCAGEYVAVERVESVLKNCPLAEQVWVYGNSFESCLVAVVVPKEKALLAWADKQGLQGTYQVKPRRRPRRRPGLLCLLFCSCCKLTILQQTCGVLVC